MTIPPKRITPAISGGRDPVHSTLGAGEDGAQTIVPAPARSKARTFGRVKLHKSLLKAFAEASGMTMGEVRAGLDGLVARGFLRRPGGIGKTYELTIPDDGEARS
jgi:hypothetical protein